MAGIVESQAYIRGDICHFTIIKGYSVFNALFNMFNVKWQWTVFSMGYINVIQLKKRHQISGGGGAIYRTVITIMVKVREESRVV
jgi:hypothetical protein